ncbi:MAG: hypothetical protein E6I03_07360 [Chloroflexi bacterium]|nr:MAG: hypothetical protein E6I03_07360 [Chloroflexota bacterium]
MPPAAPTAAPAFWLGGAVFGFSLLRGRLNLVPVSIIWAPDVSSSSPTSGLGRLARYVPGSRPG